MNKKYFFTGIFCLSITAGVWANQSFEKHTHHLDAADENKASKEDHEALKQSPFEALMQDLELVAKAKGWNIKEAAADRAAADAVGAVAEQLAAKRPDLYIGSALSVKPGGAPSLYVKGPADEMVRKLVSGSKIDIEVIDQQPYSFDELEERKLAVHRSLAEQGYKNIVTSFDFREKGMISAAVDRQEGLTNDERDIKSKLPEKLQDNVRLTVSDKPVAVDLYAYGGMLVKDDGVPECTAGWSVRSNSTGTTGVTTAGHCNGINQINHPGIGDHSMVHQAQHRGVWGDIEWKTTVALESADFYATATQIREVNSVEARANISIGESICFYGRFSNNRDCSFDVDATSVSCTVSGVFNNRLVRMDGNSAIGGDSGGGWSWNNRAYGSTKGICGGGSVFSVADLYDEAIGVSVRTQ